MEVDYEKLNMLISKRVNLALLEKEQEEHQNKVEKQDKIYIFIFGFLLGFSIILFISGIISVL